MRRSTYQAIGRVTYDMAYGGNFYAMVPIAELGMSFDQKDRMMSAGLAIMDAINEQRPPRTRSSRTSPAASTWCLSLRAGWRRCPQCHGDSSRLVRPLAVRYGHVGSHGGTARSKRACPRMSDFVNESLLGTRFIGRLVSEVPLGDVQAVVPRITGRAWITGMAQYLLDPSDPFPEGFVL